MSDRAEANADESALVCPTCAVSAVALPLRATPEAATCLGCGQTYPSVRGVPCLVPEPSRFRFEQLRNFRDYLAVTAARQRALGAERREPQRLERTRARLLQLSRAMESSASS